MDLNTHLISYPITAKVYPRNMDSCPPLYTQDCSVFIGAVALIDRALSGQEEEELQELK